MERLAPEERHESQRGYFSHALYNEMVENKDIYVVTADLGYGQFDKIKTDFEDRFINVGAAEQAAIGLSVGLALEGKVPFVYTISSFYMRSAEQISLYIAKEQIPVKLIGGGRDDQYKHDGPSHHGGNAQKLMEMLGIPSYYPQTNDEIPDLVHRIITEETPSFLSLNR